jgi:hypothetical protein
MIIILFHLIHFFICEDNMDNKNEGLNSGGIFAIIACSVIFLILVILVIIYNYCSRKDDNSVEHNSSVHNSPHHSLTLTQTKKQFSHPSVHTPPPSVVPYSFPLQIPEPICLPPTFISNYNSNPASDLRIHEFPPPVIYSPLVTLDPMYVSPPPPY